MVAICAPCKTTGKTSQISYKSRSQNCLILTNQNRTQAPFTPKTLPTKLVCECATTLTSSITILTRGTPLSKRIRCYSTNINLSFSMSVKPPAHLSNKRFLQSTPKFSIPNYDLFYGWEPKKGIYLQHATAAFVQKNIHPRMFEEYFKFTVVRNPFTRLVSVFNYNHKGHTAKYETFENFILNLRTILNKTHHQNGSHYIDQVHYSHIENERVCDEVVFFEDLPHGFKVIQRKTKLIQPLKHINKGRVGVNGVKGNA